MMSKRNKNNRKNIKYKKQQVKVMGKDYTPEFEFGEPLYPNRPLDYSKTHLECHGTIYIINYDSETSKIIECTPSPKKLLQRIPEFSMIDVVNNMPDINDEIFKDAIDDCDGRSGYYVADYAYHQIGFLGSDWEDACNKLILTFPDRVRKVNIVIQ